MADTDPSLEAGNQEPDRPEWLPENFNSPEDLAKSWQEATRKISELGAEKKALTDNYSNLAQQVEGLTARSAQPDPAQQAQQWEAAADQYGVEPGQLQVLWSLAQQASQQTLQQYATQQQEQWQPQQDSNAAIVSKLAYQSLEAKYGALDDETKSAMGQFLQERPYLVTEQAMTNPDKLADELDIVYTLATRDSQPATSQADLMRTMKQNAQSAVGAAGRPDAPDAAVAEWDAIKAARPKNYWE